MLKYIFILGPTTYNKNENNHPGVTGGIFKIHQQSDASRDSNR